MWIRSQNKKSLMKAIDVTLDIPLNSGEVGIKGYFDNNKFGMLGYYKSEERAIEVLDEIQTHISRYKVLEVDECLEAEDVVYQMPEE